MFQSKISLQKALEAGSVTGRETSDLSVASGAALKTESVNNTLKVLQGKSKKSGVNIDILQKVYNRGKKEFSKANTDLSDDVDIDENSYAMGRVNHFIKSNGKIDEDLWEKHENSKDEVAKALDSICEFDFFAKSLSLNEVSVINFLYKKDYVYYAYMSSSLGKKRDEMPQIDPEHLDAFLIHFSDKTTVKKVKRKVSELKPTQGEINEDTLDKKLESESYKKRKYIISKDNYILDGHHDWAAALEDDEDLEVTCYRVSLPIKKLLARVNRMKIAGRRNIEGDDIKKALDMLIQG